MMYTPEKPIHWAEAFGLSALLHVGLVYLLLNTVIDLDTIFAPADTPPAELQITSLAIDSGTLTGAEPGAGGASPATPQTLAPITSQDAALNPVDPAAPGPEVTELPPVTQQAQVAAVTTPQAVAPVVAAMAPPPISALRPETPTLAPTAPADPASAGTVQPVPPTPSEPAQPEAPAPTAPPPAPAPPPSAPAEPDPVAADLIERIRNALSETCLIAIPQLTANGRIGLTVYTADEATVAPYADRILADLTPRPALQTVLIDPRQCAALDFIRQGAAYPTSPMTLELDASRIASGDLLTGRLTGTGGRNITLLVVDDNGVTQDLGQYLNVAVNTARFAAPLTRAGTARDTRQLLIALATPARPAAVTAQNGQLAADYFGSLTTEVGAGAPIVLAPFNVQ